MHVQLTVLRENEALGFTHKTNEVASPSTSVAAVRV